MPAKNNNTLDLFEASVRREFAFLERDFAFPTPTRVPCDGGCVIRYLSPKVRVDLCYGAPEFEVILAFARADGGENLSVGDLLAGRRDDPVPAAAAATDGGVPGQVQFFARLLRQLGEPLLRGDADAFAALERGRREFCDTARRQEAAASVREDMMAAWQGKRFTDYVKLFDRLKDTPTDVEKQRFAYATRAAR